MTKVHVFFVIAHESEVKAGMIHVPYKMRAGLIFEEEQWIKFEGHSYAKDGYAFVHIGKVGENVALPIVTPLSIVITEREE